MGDLELVRQLLELQQSMLRPDASLDDVLDVVCTRAAALTRADGAAVEWQRGEELEYRAASGNLAGFVGLRLSRFASLSGRCLDTREVLVSRDTEADTRVDRDTCRRIGLRSMVVVPLFDDETPVGVLKVASAAPDAFGERTVALLQLLAGYVAAALVRAEQVASLRELERFRRDWAALVVHDVKSPLAAITANLEFLHEEVARADQREAAADALSATRRLDSLVRTLLDSVKLDEGRFALRLRRSVSLRELVGAVVSEHKMQVRRLGLDLENAVEVGASLTADPGLIRRVLDNLVENACRFSRRGGRIVLEGGGRADGVEVRVTNEGPAIPADQRDRVFGRFEAAGGPGLSGWGLGMHFCKLAVEAHAGRIWVDRSDGQRTVIAIALPREPRLEAAAGKAGAPGDS